MFRKDEKWIVTTKMDGKKLAPIKSKAGFDLDYSGNFHS